MKNVQCIIVRHSEPRTNPCKPVRITPQLIDKEIEELASCYEQARLADEAKALCRPSECPKRPLFDDRPPNIKRHFRKFCCALEEEMEMRKQILTGCVRTNKRHEKKKLLQQRCCCCCD